MTTQNLLRCLMLFHLVKNNFDINILAIFDACLSKALPLNHTVCKSLQS